MKILKNIAGMGAFTMLLSFCTSSCTDGNDWEADSSYERLFSIGTSSISISADTNTAEVKWTSVSGAEYYVIEVSTDSLHNAVAMGEDNAIVYGEDKSIIESPYTLTGLADGAKYFLRIKSMSATKNESKWSYYTDYSFKTQAEQLLEEVASDDITATSVTLRWRAGETATKIILTPGNIEHTVTAAEIAAGAVTITGLTGETKYTAQLLNEEKIRGTISFTTLIDLNGATPVYPGDDLAAIIAETEAGGTVVLLPAADGSNEYTFTDENGESTTLELTLTKDITIKGLYAQNRPKSHFKLILDGCNNLHVENIEFIGQGTVMTVENCDAGEISVSNCDITGFGSFLTENNNTVSGTINKFTVDNCIFHNMASGKRLIDYQKKKSFIAELNFQNSTVYNVCSGSDLIRFDYYKSGNVINITNCTFYGIEATSKGLLYIRSKSKDNKDFTANVSKCIFAKMSNEVYFSKDSKTDNIIFTSNYYSEAPSLLENEKYLVDSNGTNVEPGFKNAENGDFTVSNQTLINNQIGDPRWLK